MNTAPGACIVKLFMTVIMNEDPDYFLGKAPWPK